MFHNDNGNGASGRIDSNAINHQQQHHLHMSIISFIFAKLQQDIILDIQIYIGFSR